MWFTRIAPLVERPITHDTYRASRVQLRTWTRPCRCSLLMNSATGQQVFVLPRGTREVFSVADVLRSVSDIRRHTNQYDSFSLMRIDRHAFFLFQGTDSARVRAKRKQVRAARAWSSLPMKACTILGLAKQSVHRALLLHPIQAAACPLLSHFFDLVPKRMPFTPSFPQT